MKKLLPLLLLILIGCSGPEPINMEEMLIERDDIFYTRDTNKPYSGPVFSLRNGEIDEEGTVNNGKYSGVRKFYSSLYKYNLETEINFKNGLMDGLYKSYYVYDQYKMIPMEEHMYKNGKLHGSFKNYTMDGKQSLERTFTNGIQQGPDIIYEYEGRYKLVGSYSNGEKDGIWKTYVRDTLGIEETYKNGKLDGPFKVYISGKLFQEFNYKDGELIDSKTYNMN